MLVEQKKIETPLTRQILELIGKSGASYVEVEFALRGVQRALPSMTYVNLQRWDESRDTLDSTSPALPLEQNFR
jgi:hypothetical protein